MKRIPLIAITPTIEVQILCSLASWKALLIPYLHKKIQKINIHHHLKPSYPKQQWPKFGHCGPLGVNALQPHIVKPKAVCLNLSGFVSRNCTACWASGSLVYPTICPICAVNHNRPVFVSWQQKICNLEKLLTSVYGELCGNSNLLKVGMLRPLGLPKT
jgi:hypothetical protein